MVSNVCQVNNFVWFCRRFFSRKTLLLSPLLVTINSEEFNLSGAPLFEYNGLGQSFKNPLVGPGRPHVETLGFLTNGIPEKKVSHHGFGKSDTFFLSLCLTIV